MPFSDEQNLAVKYFAQVMAKCEREIQQKWHAIIDDNFIQLNKSKEKEFFNIVNESLNKIVEYWLIKYVNSFDALLFDQMKSDCVWHLWGQICKFNWEKMSDSFSWFNVIARGFILGEIARNKRLVYLE